MGLVEPPVVLPPPPGTGVMVVPEPPHPEVLPPGATGVVGEGEGVGESPLTSPARLSVPGALVGLVVGRGVAVLRGVGARFPVPDKAVVPVHPAVWTIRRIVPAKTAPTRDVRFMIVCLRVGFS